MHETIASPLESWASFYVIVGSSAGALTGLQFVVMTLIGEASAVRGRKDSISAFGSPNVVHFCVALLVASILSAPWGDLRHAAVAVAGCGVAGVVYSAIVLRRALRQQGYRPVFEDWLWHTVLPAFAYSTMLVAGAILHSNTVQALFAIGAAILLLVFIGIHNAWDTVTYVTLETAKQEQEVGVAGGAEARDVGAARGSGPSSSSTSAPGAATGSPEPSASQPPGPNVDDGE